MPDIENFFEKAKYDAIKANPKQITAEIVQQVLDTLTKSHKSTESYHEKTKLDSDIWWAKLILGLIIENTPKFIPRILDTCKILISRRNTSEIRTHALDVYRMLFEKAPESITANEINTVFGSIEYVRVRLEDLEWHERWAAIHACWKAIKSVPHLITQKEVDIVVKTFDDQNFTVTEYAFYTYASIIKKLPQFVSRSAIQTLVIYLGLCVEPQYNEEEEEYYPEDEMGLKRGAYYAIIAALKHTPNIVYQTIPSFLKRYLNYGDFLRLIRDFEENYGESYGDWTFLKEFLVELLKVISASKIFRLFSLLSVLKWDSNLVWLKIKNRGGNK